MALTELLQRYGENLTEHDAVARAIRVELPGGAEALEAQDQLGRLQRKASGPDAEIANLLVREIIASMTHEIEYRYGIKRLDSSP